MAKTNQEVLKELLQLEYERISNSRDLLTNGFWAILASVLPLFLFIKTNTLEESLIVAAAYTITALFLVKIIYPLYYKNDSAALNVLKELQILLITKKNSKRDDKVFTKIISRHRQFTLQKKRILSKEYYKLIQDDEKELRQLFKQI